MNAKEKAPAREATRAEAEQETACEARSSCVDSNTNRGEAQATIFDLLPVGESNAIRSKVLAELAGAASVRDLQSRIASEREQGALILSTCRNGGGYFRPSPGEVGRAEIKRYIATLKSRALNTFRAFRGAKAAIAADTELSGQIYFEEMEAML